MTVDFVCAQSRLAASGLYRGVVDGKAGPLTYAALFRFAGAAAMATDLGAGAAACFPAAGIDATALRLAHFFGQTGHETMGYRYLTEIWGPTDAQRRYEGRADLGNTVDNDGHRFLGRGLIQLTGRANYARAAAQTGLPLLNRPELAAEPANAVWTACLFWTSHRLNAFADVDDIVSLTRAINGGANGLGDRRLRTAKLKGLFA